MAGYDELSACLPHETLSELLSGGQVRPEIEAHLAACKSCQKRLDDLASADESHLQKLSSWSNFDTNKERVTQIPSYLRRLAANAPLPEVPGFQIIRELGSGGMAVVYLAKDLQLHRQVALKILLTGGLSSAEQVARFQNEAEATAKLQHPNIVQIHRTGCHDGIPFIVLELVEGPTLQEFIKHRSATPHEVAEFVSQVARAIDAAHRQNIVHRDLKPNNILLGRDGANPASNLSAFVPKVADFGLARHLDRDPDTATGTLLGTPNYMSPEQVRGDKVIAGTTDVFALGTILYELLVGELPFDGDTPMEVFAKITHERPVGPSKRNPQVPIDIDRITTKCLEKEARDRYQSAADLADDLERFLQHLPVQARPVSRLTRAFRRLKRRPVVSGMAIMLLVMVCVLVGTQYWHNQVATRTARQIDKSIYVRTIRLAETAWKSRDRTTLRTLLDSCSLDLRRAEWQLLDQLEKMRPTALRALEYRQSGRFRSWLRTVTYHALCDYLESRKRVQEKSGTDAVYRSLESAEAKDQLLATMDAECEQQLLEDAMQIVRGRVEPATWQAFVEVALNHRTADDVAAELGMKTGTVYVAKSRVKQMLAETVKELDSTH